MKLFISHSSRDQEIADAFVDLLTGGLGVYINDIFCSSTDGTKIGIGDPWRETIKKNIEKAKLVFFIVSKDFKYSEICQNELGAAWIIDIKKIIPLLIYPITPETTGSLIGDLQTANLSDSKSLESVKLIIKHHLQEIFNDNNYNDSRWINKKEELIKKVLNFEKKIKRREQIEKVQKVLIKCILYLSITIPFMLSYIMFDIYTDFTQQKEINTYKAIASFEGFDLKLRAIPKDKQSDPIILAESLEEAIPYIKDMSSALSNPGQYKITFTIPRSILKTSDSIDVLLSEFITIRLKTSENNMFSEINTEHIIDNWRRIQNDFKFEQYRKVIGPNPVLILNINATK